MSIDTTVFTPTMIRFPYIAPPALAIPDSWLTPIPRGEGIFSIFNGVVAAPSAGDSQSLSINCILPNSFAYVLVEVTCRLQDTEIGDSADWDDNMQSYVTDDASNGSWLAAPQTPGLRYRTNNLQVVGGQAFQMMLPPKKMILPKSDEGGLFLTNYNNSIDGGPMQIFFMAKFLEYDLNQAHFFAVNTAVLTR